jgi:hypothetical protein
MVLAESSLDSTNQGPLWVASFCVTAIALLALALLHIGAVLRRPFATVARRFFATPS